MRVDGIGEEARILHGVEVNVLNRAVVEADVPKLSMVVVETAQKASEAIAAMESGMAKLSPQVFLDATSRLRDASRQLQQASELAGNVQIVFVGACAASLVLSLLLCANGIALIALAPAAGHRGAVPAWPIDNREGGREQ